MKNIHVKPDAFLRHFFPLVRKTRQWSWKYFDRMGVRLVISGGPVPFMDAVLQFPEEVGLIYSTALFWNGPEAYEAPTSRLLALLISRSRAFLDIGSNVGIYSVYAGVRHPEVTTFAFEPVPAIHRKNSLFHRANHLAEERVLQLALGDRQGVQEFLLPVSTAGIEEEQTGTLNTNSWQASEETLERIPVQCSTLDRFTSNQKLPDGRCCIKIDVENHEAAVLRGGKQFIQSRRPWIVCEVLPSQKIDRATGIRTNDNAEVVSLVDELGYVPLAVTSEGYFRMTKEDFDRPRGIKDFLLAPAEAIAPNVSYLAPDTLRDLLPIS